MKYIVRLGEIGRRHCLRIQDLGTAFWELRTKDQSCDKNLVNVGPETQGDDFVGLDQELSSGAFRSTLSMH